MEVMFKMKTAKFWGDKFIPMIIPVLTIVAWQVLTSYGIIPSTVFPKPIKVVDAFFSLCKSGELIGDIGISTKRAVTGFIIGGGIGFILGLINGISTNFEKLLDTSIQMIRNVPHLALIPIVILWFGIGEESKLVLISLGVFFPIYLNTYHGIRSIDPGLMEMAKVYGFSKFSLFCNVIIPGSLPSILIGVRYALGIMWLTLIVAETVAADSGIGYLAMNAREFYQMDVVVLCIIIYALLGKLSDSIAKLLERRCLQWHPNFKK